MVDGISWAYGAVVFSRFLFSGIPCIGGGERNKERKIGRAKKINDKRLDDKKLKDRKKEKGKKR